MRRIRLLSLTPEQQNSLNSLMQQYIPSALHEEVKDSIEHTGTISDEIFRKANFSEADKAKTKALFQPIISSLPDKATAARVYADRIKDEANASDEELLNKQESLRTLGQTGEPVDRETIKRNLGGLMSRFEVGTEASKPFLDFVIQAKRLPKPGELKIYGFERPRWVNFFNDQSAKNQVAQYFQPKEFSSDIKRIQDILDTRAEEKRKEGITTEFLRQAPKELSTARDIFYRSQQAGAARYLRTRGTERILRELNIRGLAENQGDIASMLAAEGARLQGSIEEKIRSLEASDNAMFADASFRITQAKLERSEDALRTQIDFERRQARLKQETAFQEKEQELSGEFEKQVLAREQRRQLGLTEEEIELGRKTQAEETIASLTGDIGRSVGETATTAIVKRPSPAFEPVAPRLPSKIG